MGILGDRAEYNGMELCNSLAQAANGASRRLRSAQPLPFFDTFDQSAQLPLRGEGNPRNGATRGQILRRALVVKPCTRGRRRREDWADAWRRSVKAVKNLDEEIAILMAKSHLLP